MSSSALTGAVGASCMAWRECPAIEIRCSVVPGAAPCPSTANLAQRGRKRGNTPAAPACGMISGTAAGRLQPGDRIVRLARNTVAALAPERRCAAWSRSSGASRFRIAFALLGAVGFSFKAILVKLAYPHGVDR